MIQKSIHLLIIISFFLFSGCAKHKHKNISPLRSFYFNNEVNNIKLLVKTSICDKKIYKKDPILKNYQPYEIIITNNSDNVLELNARNIGLPIHSLSKIIKKAPFFSPTRKLLIAANGAGIGTYTFATLTQNLGFLAVTGLSWLTLILPVLSANILYNFISKNIRYSKIKEHLKQSIFEPEEIVTIEPHSSIRRIIYCPIEQIKQYFNITLIDTNTYQPIIFNVYLKEFFN